MSRSDESRVEHLRVRDLAQLFWLGDTLVFNTSRVVPARFVGERLDTGGKVQGLYLRDAVRPGCWVVMLKSRRFKPGAPVAMHDSEGRDSGVRLVLVKRSEDEPGAWIVRVEGAEDAEGALERFGLTPLPPYILSARRQAELDVPDTEDRERYQTVYAQEPGSVAAPTAGLHFTPELLAELDEHGVRRAEVTLHVGTGTFRPVETDTLEDHDMHAETCSMTHETLASLRAAERVIAVGTTTARAVESYADAQPPEPESISTDLFISPGYEWKLCDGLMTNFHLPRSTLLAMVASLFPAGMDRLRAIYDEAITHRYRFYSYGDAMLVLP